MIAFGFLFVFVVEISGSFHTVRFACATKAMLVGAVNTNVLAGLQIGTYLNAFALVAACKQLSYFIYCFCCFLFSIVNWSFDLTKGVTRQRLAQAQHANAMLTHSAMAMLVSLHMAPVPIRSSKTVVPNAPTSMKSAK